MAVQIRPKMETQANKPRREGWLLVWKIKCWGFIPGVPATQGKEREWKRNVTAEHTRNSILCATLKIQVVTGCVIWELSMVTSDEVLFLMFKADRDKEEKKENNQQMNTRFSIYYTNHKNIILSSNIESLLWRCGSAGSHFIEYQVCKAWAEKGQERRENILQWVDK